MKIKVSALARQRLADAVDQVGGTISSLTTRDIDGKFVIDIKDQTYARILRNKEKHESVSDYIERTLENFRFITH